MKALISSSGGKDSLLALQRAQRAGYQVDTIVMMFDETGTTSRSHGIRSDVANAQAAALGMTLVMPRSTWATYEAVFVSALRDLSAAGHTHAVFGDIDLQAHRDWEEKVCALADITPVLPLWGENRNALAAEALTSGIEAIVVCVDSRHLADRFAGRAYDGDFLADLPHGVDRCGEDGEFHTFVTNSPCMTEPVRVRVSRLRPFVAPPEIGGARFCFAELELELELEDAEILP